ncbi:MAG: S8 family serine peptidase, partial [Pseudomonadota bacterium]
MNFHRKTWALLFSTTITLTATHAQAQQDTFEQLRVAPSALTGLFDQSPSQVRDLSEAVDAAITERIEQGGTDVAHVLMTFDEPLTADRRLELEQNGIQIIDRFDETIWVARVTTRGADFAETAAPVGEATLFPSEAKLSDQISLDAPFDWQRREGSDALGYSVLFHKGISAEEAVNSLVKVTGTRVDGVDEASFPYVRSITIPLTPDALAAAAALDIVQRIEPEAPPNEDFNLNNTQPVSNVDDVQVAPYNLSGAGVTVGVWEAGDIVRPTHQDLTPRVTVQPGQTTSQDGHALHVAGTIGASGVNAPNAEGMAPAVTILSWDANSDTAEMANAATAANPIVASNHSYGARIGWTPAGTGMELQGQNLFGAYNNRSIGFDTVVAGDGVGVAGTELVILKAAGNDRGDGPNNPAQPDDCRQGGLGIDADCIGPVGSAKNVITVGAMNGGTLIAGFSGFGPTDAGRIKPDIMANGTNVTSLGSATAAGNDDIAQTDTGTWPAQGTSMATPAVTGIVALMTEQLQQLGLGPLPSAAAYKAILIQTARDVNGTGQATLGPDFATGWGIADAQAAMDLLRRAGGPGFAEGTLTATGAGGAWDFPFVVPAGETEMHVTLAWSDLPGAALVNDLDLRLLPPGGGAGFQPWTLNPANPGAAAVRNGGDDTVNTVEQVSVLNPAAGTWVARVTAKPGSLALGGQRF